MMRHRLAFFSGCAAALFVAQNLSSCDNSNGTVDTSGSGGQASSSKSSSSKSGSTGAGNAGGMGGSGGHGAEGGAGGKGATATSSTTASSSTGSGGTCKSAADCGVNNSCASYACTNSKCAMTPAAKFTPCYNDGAPDNPKGYGASCDGAGQCAIWAPVNSNGAPSARQSHSAVWTGTEMIIWGGELKGEAVTNTGARYDVASDSWKPTSVGPATPTPRHSHKAVWTGSKMIVWGGFDNKSMLPVADGGIYDPATDSWSPMATSGQPSARYDHAMLFTDGVPNQQVLVWGGYDANFAVGSGGIYDLTKNQWSAISMTGAPSPRFDFSTGWVGKWSGSSNHPNGVMLVWGGTDTFNWFGDGALYDPGTNKWLTLGEAPGPPNNGYPPQKQLQGAFAFPHTPNYNIGFYLYGGWDGGDYYGNVVYFDDISDAAPANGYWDGLCVSAQCTAAEPTPRARFIGASLPNNGLFVWGGCNGAGCTTLVGDGGQFTYNGQNDDPTNWKTFPADAALSARSDAAAVYTGKTDSEIIVWGGYDGSNPLGNGARRAVNSK